MALPGWSTFFGGLGALFGKGSTYIQTRVEKLKNEKATLEKEKAKLLQGECDEKKAARIEFIDNRLDTINQLLSNKAGD
ncbi:MAG: hypothetical protein WC937_06690 [Candidatus Omnitrophota bacterium]|jgi:hypothetical protein